MTSGKHFIECELDKANYEKSLIKIGICNKALIQRTLNGMLDREPTFRMLYCGNGDKNFDFDFIPYVKKIDPGSRVGVMLDMDNGTLEFTVDGQRMGLAHEDPELKAGEWFYTVWTRWVNDRIRILNKED